MINSARINGKDPNSYPPIKKLPASDILRILVTGGAGFVGILELMHMSRLTSFFSFLFRQEVTLSTDL